MKERYRYYISGYYIANGERKHFGEEITATDNIEAMQKVIGLLAWGESIKGNNFRLDAIHYECL